MKNMFSIQKLETMHIKKLVLTNLQVEACWAPYPELFSIAFVTVEELLAMFRPGLNKDFLVFCIFFIKNKIT
jgi:hypothetical protein